MASVYYAGLALSIMITDDGLRSIAALAETHRDMVINELARGDSLIQTFGDNGRLRSPDQFRKEGDGFWAIRAGHIRFYGWYEPNKCFVISHVIYKNHAKLASADMRRMHKNQREYRGT